MYIKLYKVKKNKVDIWREWGKELMTSRKDDAIETLKLENVIEEGFFLFEIDGVFYSFGYMTTEAEFIPNRDHSLNKLHRQKIKECLAPTASRPEIVYHLNRPLS